VLGDTGSMHVCDASDEQIAQLEDFHKPTAFCIARKILLGIGIPHAETPGAAFQIIVPLMFILIGLRLIMQGIEAAATAAKGLAAMQAAEAEEHARMHAVQASTSMKPPAGGAT
jgi:hypothetical protein